MSITKTPLALFAFLTQSVLLALGQIWSNKVRSLLTTMGIIIGVASVTAVIAALTGLKANVLADFETIGNNKIAIFAQHPQTGRHRQASWRSIRLVPENFDGMLEHCPSVEAFTRITGNNEDVIFGDESIEAARITGIEPAWHEVDGRTVTIGRPFNLVDETEARPVCLISPDTRDELRLDRDCTGQSIYIGRTRFLIVGVVEPPVEFAVFGAGGPDHEIFIPFRTAWRRSDNWMYVVANAVTPEASDEAGAEIRFYLRRQRELRPEDPDTFGINLVEAFVETFSKVASAITMVAGGIVGISLLVGGVGIMNVMLVSVSERTREIGLRKAVGATPSAILLQFLIEAVTLCSIGGFVGIAGGQLLTMGMGMIPGAFLERAYIPIWAMIVSIGFSAVVGVFFGIFPAVKAARLDPIEALRHE
jgi:putative ABC transport system permease protein